VRRRLAGLLRARQAQEDVARGKALRAQREAEAAAERVRRYHEAIDLRQLPDGVNASVYAATLSAHRAMAYTLNAAIASAGEADAHVRDRAADVTEAAMRRRAVERLHERETVAARKAADGAEQRVLDDLTRSAQPRNPRRTDR